MILRRRHVWIVLASIAFVAMAAVSVARLGRDVRRATGVLPRSDPAPEFERIDGWINTVPLTLANLRGKVVLVDFWTYTCINCVRTFPGLKTLYTRYKPSGLEIVGVHSPEFEFEHEASNVRRAVAEHGITWPVALDNAFATWRAYRNRNWPHLFLIDQTGRIRFDHIGEGGEDVVEAKIRALLAAGGAKLPPDQTMPEENVFGGRTPEIYLGFERGSVERSLGNREGYQRTAPFTYPAPSAALVEKAGPDGVFFLASTWRARDEYVRSERAGARIILTFSARDVYFVAAPNGVKEVTARLLLDGKPIDAARSGADVKDGGVRLGAQTLYHLVHLAGLEEHRLEIVAEGPGLAVYTFTFG